MEERQDVDPCHGAVYRHKISNTKPLPCARGCSETLTRKTKGKVQRRTGKVNSALPAPQPRCLHMTGIEEWLYHHQHTQKTLCKYRGKAVLPLRSRRPGTQDVQGSQGGAGPLRPHGLLPEATCTALGERGGWPNVWALQSEVVVTARTVHIGCSGPLLSPGPEWRVMASLIILVLPEQELQSPQSLGCFPSFLT